MAGAHSDGLRHYYESVSFFFFYWLVEQGSQTMTDAKKKCRRVKKLVKCATDINVNTVKSLWLKS